MCLACDWDADFRSGSEQHESEKTVQSGLHGPNQPPKTLTPKTQNPVPVGFWVLPSGSMFPAWSRLVPIRANTGILWAPQDQAVVAAVAVNGHRQ